MDIQTQRLLAQAVAEIKSLRLRNNFIESRLQIYDNMMSMFMGGPKHESIGMGEDIAWQIEKHIESNPVKE